MEWVLRIEAIRQEGGLDVSNFDPESPGIEVCWAMARQPVNLIETMCCYLFDKGPGLTHEMTVTGPIRLIRALRKSNSKDYKALSG